MFCNNCGTDIGELAGLCEQCAELNAVSDQEQSSEVETKSRFNAHRDEVTKGKITTIIYVVLFSLTSLVVVYFLLRLPPSIKSIAKETDTAIETIGRFRDFANNP